MDVARNKQPRGEGSSTTNAATQKEPNYPYTASTMEVDETTHNDN
jgi:hypothetical protein